MIEETAYVVEANDSFAWVETERKTSCGSCSVSAGCGTSVLSKVIGNKRATIRAINRAQVVAGDTVIIGLQEGALVKGSMMLYAVPLALLFGFALMGQLLAQIFGWSYSDGGQITMSGIGFAIGFAWVYRFSKRIVTDEQFQAVVLRKADSVVTFYPTRQT